MDDAESDFREYLKSSRVAEMTENREAFMAGWHAGSERGHENGLDAAGLGF